MAWFTSKVEVTFIDDATGESFAVTQMPAADLPESFEIDTTLHIGNEDWSVVAAQPAIRQEYAKSKILVLRLRRIEQVDPGNILFSLPSICDAIPALGDLPLEGNEFVLAEDDWRQFEFVSNELADEAAAEIDQILLIHQTASADAGWSKIHVRSKPEPPLLCDLTLSDLADSLDLPAAAAGVTWYGTETQVADGYSFAMDGGPTLYGIAPNGKVQVIAIDLFSASQPMSETINRLTAFAHDRNLNLVQWCRCLHISPDHPDFGALLSDERNI